MSWCSHHLAKSEQPGAVLYRADDEETALCLTTRAVIAQAQGDSEQAAQVYAKACRWEPYLARDVEELRYRHYWRARALEIFAELKETICKPEN